MPEPCEICKKPSNNFCARCRAVWYCGAACQSKAWPAHSLDCVPPETRARQKALSEGMKKLLEEHGEADDLESWTYDEDRDGGSASASSAVPAVGGGGGATGGGGGGTEDQLQGLLAEATAGGGGAGASGAGASAGSLQRTAGGPSGGAEVLTSMQAAAKAVLEGAMGTEAEPTASGANPEHHL
jgi:hypothetical protein